VSAALAGGYRGLGLEPGDRVASLVPNRVDLVVHYLACFRAGLIATPLNYRYTARGALAGGERVREAAVGPLELGRGERPLERPVGVQPARAGSHHDPWVFVVKTT
jgi:AMP-binding enzyme